MTAGNEIRPSRQQGESWSVERITNDKASQGHRLHTIQEDVKLSSKPARESGKGYSDEDAVLTWTRYSKMEKFLGGVKKLQGMQRTCVECE